ncbi:PREDICTED: uncharacterized protein LOC104707825 [Camelina sativa]|uniref:Uncharacterized protein LOC104707825 n=1 Tax=Camelina sativa TaxID=90675 RepID=A0ABM0T8N7_CAMSA|nr:PREDICTED: uncharacterized protein LOC104707825 [Camelina sativa]
MKTSMSIVVVFFFVAFYAISAASLNPEETCIRRNMDRSRPPSSSLEPNKSMFDSLRDTLCRDMGRAVMFYVRINGKFPSHYVKAMCNVFGNDEKKVKEYVMEKWLGGSKLVSNISCAIH